MDEIAEPSYTRNETLYEHAVRIVSKAVYYLREIQTESDALAFVSYCLLIQHADRFSLRSFSDELLRLKTQFHTELMLEHCDDIDGFLNGFINPIQEIRIMLEREKHEYDLKNRKLKTQNLLCS